MFKKNDSKVYCLVPSGATKLDYNWRFLVELFATFAPMGVPSLSKFKAWIQMKNNTLIFSFFFFCCTL